MLTSDQTKQYLKRLDGIEWQLPTIEFLSELHRAHVEKVTWNTMDIFAGKGVPFYRTDSVNHIVNNKSGGYCFHLNGAFSLLLESLGYDVSLHRAGVQPHGTEPRIDSYHLGLSVNMVNDNLEVQKWIIDVGLGDMLYEPIPLIPGDYRQGPDVYKVVNSDFANDAWRLVHDPAASFTAVDVDPEEVRDMEQFKSKHEYLSTSPESTWVNIFIVRNRRQSEINELRGCIFSQRNESGTTKSEITNRSLWFETLGEVFGEQLNHYNRLEKDELWIRVLKTHEDWKRKQQDLHSI